MNRMKLLTTLLLALSLACTVEGTTAPGDTGATEANDTGEDTHDDTGDDTELDFDTAPDTDPDTHTYDSGEVDPTELPNLSEGLDSDACEEVPGYEDLAGATSYFVGTYARIEDGTWIGFETWLLYATSEWEASGGADCQVVWDVAGSETSPDACPGCELALSLSATVNAGSTSLRGVHRLTLKRWGRRQEVPKSRRNRGPSHRPLVPGPRLPTRTALALWSFGASPRKRRPAAAAGFAAE